jgi:hypothetical protein
MKRALIFIFTLASNLAFCQDSLESKKPISIANELNSHYLMCIQIDELPKTAVGEFLVLIDQNGLRLVKKDVISNPSIIRTCRPDQVITYVDGLPVSNKNQVQYAQPMEIKLLGLPAKFENETTLDIE